MAWNKDITGKVHEFYRCDSCSRLITHWQIKWGLHACPRCGGRKVIGTAPRFFEKVFLFFNSKY
jgi:DNA-directed RNA polymerase subunit RPC12/RpoP